MVFPFLALSFCPGERPSSFYFITSTLINFAEYFPAPFAAVARFLESSVTRAVYGDRLVTCVSPSTRRDVRLRLRMRGRVAVIPHGGLPIATLALSTGERSPTPTITCVGRLVPHKRAKLVVEAVGDLISSLPDLHLHLVGDGPERPALEALVETRHLASWVTFHGAIDPDIRDRLLRSAWLTVSASVREGWGQTILEANAFGIPGVGLHRPGLRDSIRDGETGWLVEDERDLAGAIGRALEALANPVVAEAYAGRCQEWAQAFPGAESVRRFEQAIAEESGRLAARRERRTVSDLGTVVTIPLVGLGRPFSPGLIRATDQALVDVWGVTMLLHGTDHDGASVCLSRLGVSPGTPGVSVRLARPLDFLALRPPGLPGSVSAQTASHAPGLRLLPPA